MAAGGRLIEVYSLDLFPGLTLWTLLSEFSMINDLLEDFAFQSLKFNDVDCEQISLHWIQCEYIGKLWSPIAGQSPFIRH